MKKTQKQIILEQLRQKGSVSNVWAINHFILRLSERIRELEMDGYEIERGYEVKKGKKTKNFVYTLTGYNLV